MPSVDEILAAEICECGCKSVADAIAIFQANALPFKKAKKLVTECDKNCCRGVLLSLFEMTEFGKFDYDEIHRLNTIRHDKIRQLVERLTNE